MIDARPRLKGGTQSFLRSSCVFARAQDLGHLSMLSQGAGAEPEHPGLEITPSWDVGTIGGQ